MNAESQPATIFAQIVLILVLSHITVDADGCKKMILLPDKDGNYLRNHTVQTLATQSHSMCRVMCYLSDSCLSYNFQESTGTCDINDSDEFEHPDDMVSKSGYIYVGTENGCKSNPCPSNSTCQPSFTYEGGFTCSCPMGFTGSSCNKDIDECTSGTHNCSAHSTCQNTEGSFQCLDADECTSGTHNCPAFSKCENTAPYFRCLPLGTRENPASSCFSIRTNGYSSGTGEYWLDPANTGSPIQAKCDMKTDGGGWTIVKRLVQPNSAQLTKEEFKDTYEVIKEYDRTDANIIPKGAAMMDIKKKLGFHQIHFYCYKRSAGRVVSIMTKNNTAGQQVVRYFTDDASAAAKEFPKACDSFDRLPEDTSILSQNCSKWGGDPNGAKNVDKWGGVGFHGPIRIVARPFQIVSAPTSAFAYQHKYVLCDEQFYSPKQLQANDIWQISVR